MEYLRLTDRFPELECHAGNSAVWLEEIALALHGMPWLLTNLTSVGWENL